MGPRGLYAYPQWGSEVECRDVAQGALFVRRPVAWSECALQHLTGSTVGQRVQERLWLHLLTRSECARILHQSLEFQ